MNRIELLAPARDLECGKAAIQCGADAVYIGAPRFGARENAGNSIADIAALADWAHTYWARVYVTLNTLLYDAEIPQAVHLAWRLFEVGVDALIIQDVGLLECDLPPLPLIASTQMNNRTPEKVAFLEQAGFQRAILARELSLEEIRAIRRKAPRIELEFFVHGSLCVCYSGQCYLSYAFGGRSGNRGQCAQPCRKAYTLTTHDGRNLGKSHWMSIQDLNLSGYLPQLIEAGIQSFKIEGRLKDKTYVSNTVAFYRKQLDQELKQLEMRKSSSGSCEFDFEPNLNKTFNRGYTAHFLPSGRTKIGAHDTPKMVGESIGRVVEIKSSTIQLDTNSDLHPGDGICFFDRRHVLRGSLINAAQGCFCHPERMDGLEKGTLVFRNHDHEFLNRLQKTRTERKIAVEIRFKQTPDGWLLSGLDEDGVSVEIAFTYCGEPARDPGQAEATIRKQLQKTGGTDFLCIHVGIEMAAVCFIPMGMLNQWRRELLDRLTEERKIRYPKVSVCHHGSNVPYPERTLTYHGNVLNQKAEAFYRRHGVQSVEPAAESGMPLQRCQVMTSRYCLRYETDQCPKQNPSIPSARPWVLMDEEGHHLELRFDCSKCEMQLYNQSVSVLPDSRKE